jgi:hypothetical protein
MKIERGSRHNEVRQVSRSQILQSIIDHGKICKHFLSSIQVIKKFNHVSDARWEMNAFCLLDVY